jgi:hypothetical protein
MNILFCQMFGHFLKNNSAGTIGFFGFLPVGHDVGHAVQAYRFCNSRAEAGGLHFDIAYRYPLLDSCVVSKLARRVNFDIDPSVSFFFYLLDKIFHRNVDRSPFRPYMCQFPRLIRSKSTACKNGKQHHA